MADHATVHAVDDLGKGIQGVVVPVLLDDGADDAGGPEGNGEDEETCGQRTRCFGVIKA